MQKGDSVPLQPTTKATLTSASRMGRQLTQGCFYALSLLFFQAYLCAPALAQSLSEGVGDLRVMTYNANEGTDFLEVQQTTTSFEFLEAVGQTITQVRATNPPERMKALASQIIAASPTLVGVQELDQWSTGSLDPYTFTCAATTTIEFDMLQELQDALAAQGAHYELAVQAQQYAFPPIPGLTESGILCVLVVNNIAVFARRDLSVSKSQWSNSQPG